MTTTTSKNKLIKGAVAGGVINAIINGVINWFQVKGKTDLFLTVDNITSTEHTVLGGAVMLATSLAAILTIIGYFTVKSKNKPHFFPKALGLTLRNTFFAFGLMVTIGVMVQRIFGSVAVTPVTSVILVGIIAGFVAGIIDYMTKKELLS